MRILGLTALALTISTAAAAADAATNGRFTSQFLTLDTNKDGSVTKAEVEGQRSRAFDRADKDKNGVVSQAEIEEIKRRDRGQGRAFSKVDADRDGSVTKSEYLARDLHLFTRYDANADGVLDSAEIEAARQDGRRRAGAAS